MLEGDTSGIPSETIRALHEIGEQETNEKNYRIILNLAAKLGTNNFTGTIYRAAFCSQSDIHTENVREQKIILKVAAQQSEWRELFSTRSTFLQEQYMYDTVSSNYHLKEPCFLNLNIKLIYTHRCCHIFVNLRNQRV